MRSWEAEALATAPRGRQGLRPVGPCTCLSLEEAVAHLPCRDSVAKELLYSADAVSLLDSRPVVWGQDLLRVTKSMKTVAKESTPKPKRPRKRRRSIAELTGKNAKAS